MKKQVRGNKKKFIGINVPVDLANKIKATAKAQRRSVSAHICVALETLYGNLAQ